MIRRRWLPRWCSLKQLRLRLQFRGLRLPLLRERRLRWLLPHQCLLLLLQSLLRIQQTLLQRCRLQLLRIPLLLLRLRRLWLVLLR